MGVLTDFLDDRPACVGSPGAMLEPRVRFGEGMCILYEGARQIDCDVFAFDESGEKQRPIPYVLCEDIPRVHPRP